MKLKDESHKLSDDDIRSIAEKTVGYSVDDLDHLCNEAAKIFVESDRSHYVLQDFEIGLQRTKKTVDTKTVEELKEWCNKHGEATYDIED